MFAGDTNRDILIGVMKNITYTDTKNRNWNYQIPFLITCTVSGTVKKYTSEEYINKKIERFDGLDNLRMVYVSRDAKRALKGDKKGTVQAKSPDRNLFKEMIESAPLCLPAPKPVAKKDKQGKYRNEKGHLISAANLAQYQIAA